MERQSGRIQHYPLEEPIVLSRVSTSMTREANRYYTEWVRPQGIIDAVAIGLERNSAAVSSLSFGRHHSAGDIEEVELSGLRMVAPHIRRAVAISQILEVKTIEASTFFAILEAFTAGIVLVDPRMAIVQADTAAQAMLAAKDPIRLRGGGLALPLDAATAALEAAVIQAARDETELSARSGIGIPAWRRDGGTARLVLCMCCRCNAARVASASSRAPRRHFSLRLPRRRRNYLPMRSPCSMA